MPRCAKCLRKGIECSGIGQSYQFITVNSGHNSVRNQASTAKPLVSSADPNDGPFDSHCFIVNHLDKIGRYARGPLFSLEPLGSDSRKLFDYCKLQGQIWGGNNFF